VNLRRTSLVVQLVAIAVGVWIGIVIFEWVSGADVRLGF
jgi:hypothetical protein